jgi:hypothetical protein
LRYSPDLLETCQRRADVGDSVSINRAGHYPKNEIRILLIDGTKVQPGEAANLSGRTAMDAAESDAPKRSAAIVSSWPPM